jgi:D-alanine-D-alanine ligase
MKAVVLHSDIPEKAGRDEQDVLVQTETVCRSLTELGHTPVALPVSMDFKKAVDILAGIRPDFVFNLVESIDGHGGLIHIAPSIMDSLNIPYTGAKTDAMFLTSNKVLAKKFLDAKEMPTPPSFLADDRQSLFMEGSYIIKAIWEHASVWLDEHSIIDAKDGDRLRLAILSQQERLGMTCFAEPFIDGREFNLSLLAGDTGPEVLPPAEIQFRDYPVNKAKVVDYRSKWVEDSFEYHHTPRRFDFPEEDDPLIKQLTELAIQCWYLFNLRGYARVDFRVDVNNYAWILEVNTNPCLSPDGGFAAAVKQCGLTFNRAIERIVQDALRFQYLP